MPAPQFHIYIAISADGFIAREDGSVDWLAPFDAEDYGYEDFAADIDAIIMGRKTFEQVQGFGEWPYQGLATHVLSSRALENAPEGVTHAGSLDALLPRLEGADAPRTVWALGGADLIHGFLERGLIGRLDLFIMPLLLGSGIPLFKQGGQEKALTLLRSKSFPNGVVTLHYKM